MIPGTFDFDKAGFFGRDDIVAEVIRQALDPDAEANLTRSLIIQGPARRGKSWVLHGVYERLRDPQAQASPTGSPPSPGQASLPVATAAIFTVDQLPPPDYHHALARAWDALLPHVPSLARPQTLQPTDAEDDRLRKLHGFLQGANPDWSRLIEVAVAELEQTTPPVYLVLLVDGLDEYDPVDLDQFEFRFLEQLFKCPRVRLVATRRSEVIAHGWRRSLIKRHTRLVMLHTFTRDAAKQQVNHLLKGTGSSLSYGDLQAQLKHYQWQNPGANAHLVACAAPYQASPADFRFTAQEIEGCIRYLSSTQRLSQPIDNADLGWLLATVRRCPSIDLQAQPRRAFSGILGGAGDKARDDWLGRLKERGIILVKGRDSFLVHEEFVALCQELEARSSP